MDPTQLEHGTFSVQVSGDVLYVRCSGTWNYPTAERYVREMTRCGEQLSPGPWCSLADLTNWELGTPDASGLIIRLSATLSELGRRHAAGVVGPNQLARTVSNHFIERLKRDAAPEVRYFDTEDEARRWLTGLGYSLGELEDDSSPGTP